MESQVVHHVCLYSCFIILSVCISVYLLCCCYSYNTYNLVCDWNSREYGVTNSNRHQNEETADQTTVRPREATQNYTEDLGRATHTLSFPLSLAGPTEKPCKEDPTHK